MDEMFSNFWFVISGKFICSTNNTKKKDLIVSRHDLVDTVKNRFTEIKITDPSSFYVLIISKIAE